MNKLDQELVKLLAEGEILKRENKKSFWEFEFIWLWRAAITIAVAYILFKIL